MEQTKTTTGLTVVVRVIDKVYQTGKKCAEDFLDSMRLVFDDVLPRWNYAAVPLVGVHREVI